MLGFFQPGASAAGETALIESGVDGDTVVMVTPIERARQIRLVSIQASKLFLGLPNFKQWPLANQAKKVLVDLSLGKMLTLNPWTPQDGAARPFAGAYAHK